MGIDVSAVLIYGLPYEEVREIYHTQHPEENVDFHGWVETNDFDSASPCYDSDYSDRVFGIKVVRAGYYSYSETSLYKIDVAIQDAERAFIRLTGKCGKLYISPDVT